MKASLLVWKKQCTVEKYCDDPKIKFMAPFLEEVLSMAYSEEPNYAKLKFLLVKSLLDRNLEPSANALCESSPIENPLLDITEDEFAHKIESDPIINTFNAI